MLEQHGTHTLDNSYQKRSKIYVIIRSHAFSSLDYNVRLR